MKPSSHPVLAAVFFIGLTASAARAVEFPAGSPDFRTDYNSAMRAARASSKPMLVVFSANWCTPCQIAKHKLYPSDSVKPYHDQFVWVYLDFDDPRNRNVIRHFGVSSIPHIQFVNPDGSALDRSIGTSRPAAFARKLRAVQRRARG